MGIGCKHKKGIAGGRKSKEREREREKKKTEREGVRVCVSVIEKGTFQETERETHIEREKVVESKDRDLTLERHKLRDREGS